MDVTGSLASDTQQLHFSDLSKVVYETQARFLSSWISRVISVPPRIRTGFQIDLYPSEHCQHVKVRTGKFSFPESSAYYVDAIQTVQAEPCGRPKTQGMSLLPYATLTKDFACGIKTGGTLHVTGGRFAQSCIP